MKTFRVPHWEAKGSALGLNSSTIQPPQLRPTRFDHGYGQHSNQHLGSLLGAMLPSVNSAQRDSDFLIRKPLLGGPARGRLFVLEPPVALPIGVLRVNIPTLQSAGPREWRSDEIFMSANSLNLNRLSQNRQEPNWNLMCSSENSTPRKRARERSRHDN